MLALGHENFDLKNTACPNASFITTIDRRRKKALKLDFFALVFYSTSPWGPVCFRYLENVAIRDSLGCVKASILSVMRFFADHFLHSMSPKCSVKFNYGHFSFNHRHELKCLLACLVTSRPATKSIDFYLSPEM